MQEILKTSEILSVCLKTCTLTIASICCFKRFYKKFIITATEAWSCSVHSSVLCPDLTLCLFYTRPDTLDWFYIFVVHPLLNTCCSTQWDVFPWAVMTEEIEVHSCPSDHNWCNCAMFCLMIKDALAGKPRPGFHSPLRSLILKLPEGFLSSICCGSVHWLRSMVHARPTGYIFITPQSNRSSAVILIAGFLRRVHLSYV